MSPRPRTALIGLGRWGRNVALALGRVSDLAAVVTARPSSGEEWRTQHLPAVGRVTLEQVLADKAITAVAVATPIPTLARFAEAALNAGKHVFAEKPLAQSLDEARKLAELAASSGLVLQTGYVFLHHPVWQELKRRVAIADVRAIRMEWRKFGTFDEPIELSLLVHHLSLALDLAGVPHGGTIWRGASAQSACDSIEARLDYGGLSIISAIDRTVEQRAHTIAFDMRDGSRLVWEGARMSRHEHARATAQVVYENTDPALDAEMRAFVAAVQGCVAPIGAGMFAADVLRVIEGLRSA